MLVKTLYAYTPVPVIFSVMVTRTKDLKSEVTNQDQKPSALTLYNLGNILPFWGLVSLSVKLEKQLHHKSNK